MRQHTVAKIIEFCYGHRLLNHKSKCRNLHGHNAVLEVHLEADELDQNGMVIDFGDIRDAVKKWVDFNLDHKMLLSKKDPVVKALMDLEESYYLMDENPTAENIAKLIFNEMRKMRFPVSEIRLWETPSSMVTYRMQE